MMLDIFWCAYLPFLYLFLWNVWLNLLPRIFLNWVYKVLSIFFGRYMLCKFFPDVLTFHLSDGVFQRAIFNFWILKVLINFFLNHAFGSYLGNLHLIQSHKDFLLCFLLGVLLFYFLRLGLWTIFSWSCIWYEVWTEVLFICTWMTNCFQHHLLKRLYILNFIAFIYLSVVHKFVGLFLDSVVFCISIYLSKCQYYTVLITVAQIRLW